MLAEFPAVRLDLALREDVPTDPAERPDLQIAVEQGRPTGPAWWRSTCSTTRTSPCCRSIIRWPRTTELDLAELAGERWVDNDFARGWCRRNLIEACHAAGFSPPFHVEAHDYPTAIAFVAAGIGVTVLPRLGAAAPADRGGGGAGHESDPAALDLRAGPGRVADTPATATVLRVLTRLVLRGGPLPATRAASMIAGRAVGDADRRWPRCSAVLVQLALVITGASPVTDDDVRSAGDPAVALRQLFTIQSNLLVIITVLPLITAPAHGGRAVAGAAAAGLVMITVTGLVHWFLLRPLRTLDGWSAVADLLLHVVVPVLTVVGWLVFGPRPRITAPRCLVVAVADRLAGLHAGRRRAHRLVPVLLPRRRSRGRRGGRADLRSDHAAVHRTGVGRAGGWTADAGCGRAAGTEGCDDDDLAWVIELAASAAPGQQPGLGHRRRSGPAR